MCSYPRLSATKIEQGKMVNRQPIVEKKWFLIEAALATLAHEHLISNPLRSPLEIMPYLVGNRNQLHEGLSVKRYSRGGS